MNDLNLIPLRLFFFFEKTYGNCRSFFKRRRKHICPTHLQGQILNHVAYSEIKNLAGTTNLAVFYLKMICPLPVTLRMHVLKYWGSNFF